MRDLSGREVTKRVLPCGGWCRVLSSAIYRLVKNFFGFFARTPVTAFVVSHPVAPCCKVSRSVSKALGSSRLSAI